MVITKCNGIRIIGDKVKDVITAAEKIQKQQIIPLTTAVYMVRLEGVKK